MEKRSVLRAFFRLINRFIVVPAFQLGWGRIISNPITGDVMVLGITGRKTGKIRYTPVSYARMGPNIYCYQGREMKGQWYLNLLANPKIEVLLPEGRFSGHGEVIHERAEKLKAIRQILLKSGLNRTMYGFDPKAASDEEVQEKTRGMPVIRIRLDSMTLVKNPKLN
jgi:deazaflavin-dependent oxidoreductase (nitroreductase family)